MRVLNDDEYWGGFKAFLTDVGWPNPMQVSAAAGDQRILVKLAEIETRGSGHWRTYGPRIKARVLLYMQMQPVFGWGDGGSSPPEWCWSLLDFGLEYPPEEGGFLVVKFGNSIEPTFEYLSEIDLWQFNFGKGALILPIGDSPHLRRTPGL